MGFCAITLSKTQPIHSREPRGKTGLNRPPGTVLPLGEAAPRATQVRQANVLAPEDPVQIALTPAGVDRMEKRPTATGPGARGLTRMDPTGVVRAKEGETAPIFCRTKMEMVSGWRR